ncbi:retrovirus-related pol polyprotein from transposon TNT 1-94 [Tanacetum coccineum]|uniref:Retrovirus-related pol polyprotein from transposon TNT 1-94 n=1 Tax=Tanacetum coccineum TaxID=301880 RepID=A0ABQ5F266_9ASTR
MQDKKQNLSFFHVFGSLCYPTNDHDDLGKFNAKAYVGIFIGYAHAKKAFKIYNRRTWIITETIHVTFDELTSMASEQFSSVLELHVQEAPAPRAEVLVDSPVSTSIDPDAPSINTTSHGSSSYVRQIHTPLEHLGRWTKDHPIANVIGDPSCSVATRKQLHTDAMWCYFDAFLTSVEPKKFKQAMTEPSWIDMTSKFKMSMMGKMSFFLGLQISQSPRGIFINQSKYASEIVKKYGLNTTDSVDTPMIETKKLDEDLQGKPVDATLYRGMIGSLMYLTASRPDLNYDVCLCARYQAKPTEKHLQAVKRIF